MDKLRIWDYDEIAKGPGRGGIVQGVPDSAIRPGELENEWRLRMLLKHLQTLAADADTVLRAYSSKFGAVDELVNDFDHYLRLSQKAADEGLITPHMLDKARLVDAKITEMSEKDAPELWSDEGLRTKQEWIVVRQLARDALEALGYALEPPPPGSM